MRSFVRQDLDVIPLGEIRDAEFALESVRPSRAGHLVLSTLHCNETTGSIQRLIDLGLHPNSIASDLQAVIAQTAISLGISNTSDRLPLGNGGVEVTRKLVLDKFGLSAYHLLVFVGLKFIAVGVLLPH